MKKNKSLRKIKWSLFDREGKYIYKFSRKKANKRKDTLSSYEVKIPSTQLIIDEITYTVIDDFECLKANLGSVDSTLSKVL